MPKKMKNKKILIIGDLILDEYQLGDVERISPEAPVPIVKIIKKYASLGGAGNVLKNIQSVGGNANLISLVGNDIDGLELKKILKKSKSDKYIFDESEFNTTKKIRIISNSQHLLRIDYERRNYDKFSNDKNLEKILNIIEQEKPDFIILSDYNKGFFNQGLFLSHITNKI